MKNRYQIEKANARQKAIDWQHYFETLGKRYGLLTEFKKNGIC